MENVVTPKTILDRIDTIEERNGDRDRLIWFLENINRKRWRAARDRGDIEEMTRLDLLYNSRPK